MRSKTTILLVLAGALLVGVIASRLIERGSPTRPVMPSCGQDAPHATVEYVYEAPLVPLRPR